MLSHTPPAFSMSIGREPPQMKKSKNSVAKSRPRNNSISGRLRSLSEVCADGGISKDDKGVLKGLIIKGDERAEEAIRRYQAGDDSMVKEIVSNSKDVFVDDLIGLDDLQSDFLNNFGPSSFGSYASGSFRKNSYMNMFSMDQDGVHGDASFNDEPNPLYSINPIPISLKNSDPYEVFPVDMDDKLNYFEGDESEHNQKETEQSRPDFVSAQKTRHNSLLDAFGGDEVYSQNLFGLDDITSSMPIGIPKRSARRNSNISELSFSVNPELVFEQGSNVAQSSQSISSSTSVEAKMHTARYHKSKGVTMKAIEEELQGTSIENRSKTLPPELIQSAGENGYIGEYSPEARRALLEKFLQKRQERVWKKRVKYDVRKNFADSRLRVKGRFVRKEDEELLREIMLMTI